MRSTLRMKSGDGLEGTAQCSANASNGNLSCWWNERRYRTSTNPRELEGLGFRYEAGSVFGVNLMDYLTVASPTDPTWNARASLSATQIARVRTVLREMVSRDAAVYRPGLGTTVLGALWGRASGVSLGDSTWASRATCRATGPCSKTDRPRLVE